MSLTAPQSPIGAAGGAGTVIVATQPECAWTPSAEAVWIGDVTPTRGQGNGEVRFSAAANPNGTPREGGIRVSGQRAVIQQAASPCQLSAAVSEDSMPATGGSAVVTVSTPGGCPWVVISHVGWITVSPTSGSGAGSVALNVASNAGPARTGVMTVGAATITIAQASGLVTGPIPGPGPGPAPSPGPSPGPGTGTPGQTCSFSINPRSQSVGALGGVFAVAVTAPNGCQWTAASHDGWVTITGGGSGTGSGTVSYAVGLNLVGSRGATLTIAGQTLTVNQAGVLP